LSDGQTPGGTVVAGGGGGGTMDTNTAAIALVSYWFATSHTVGDTIELDPSANLCAFYVNAGTIAVGDNVLVTFTGSQISSDSTAYITDGICTVAPANGQFLFPIPPEFLTQSVINNDGTIELHVLNSFNGPADLDSLPILEIIQFSF
jgi:hypothetical protein